MFVFSESDGLVIDLSQLFQPIWLVPVLDSSGVFPACMAPVKHIFPIENVY